MTLIMRTDKADSGCALTSDEFERIASGVNHALHELSAPEPVRRALSMQMEALRSRLVLVKPAAGARRL
jgi:hypothetical protein